MRLIKLHTLGGESGPSNYDAVKASMTTVAPWVPVNTSLRDDNEKAI